MGALQQIFKRIRDQLGGLSINAQLLIGSTLIILVMGLLLVSQYAGESRMAPLGLPATAQVREGAVRQLKLMNVAYEDRGDDIYVPASEQYAIIGQLSARDVVSTTQIDFNALIDRNANPFIGRDQARQNWLTAKMNVLSTMIAARDDVLSAEVIIDSPTGTPGIGAALIPPKASVAVAMNGSMLTQEIADALGRMVAGAEAGLKVENVTVTDLSSSRSFIPRAGEGFASSSYLEQKQKTEIHFRRMLLEAVGVPNAIVSVNAVVRNTMISSQERSIDEPKIGPLSSESRDMNATNARQSNEPGVRPNTGAAIAAGAPSGSSVVESRSVEKTKPVFGGIDRTVQDPTGYPLQVNAVIGLPRSFFEHLAEAQQQDANATPDPAVISQLFEQKKQELESSLALLVQTGAHPGAEAGEVVVRLIDDLTTNGQPAAFTATLASTDTGAIGGGASLLKNLALGALALMSVVMMFLMVRQANRREELPSSEELVGIPPSLQVAESDIVGEADEGEPALEGIELGDDTMRTQQLMTQIREMVDENPAEAASIFQRWVSNSE